MSDVTCSHPAIVSKCIARLIWFVPVTEHHVGATCFDFAIHGDANLDVADGLACRANAKVVNLPRGNYRRSLSQAIALHNRQSCSQKSERDVVGNRGASGNQQSNTTAHGLSQLLKNQ